MTLQAIHALLFPQGRPTLETVASITGHHAFPTAVHFLVLNGLLVLLALLWGAALTLWLIQREKQSTPALPAVTLVFIAIAGGLALMIAQLFLLVALSSLTAPSVILLFGASSFFSGVILWQNRLGFSGLLIPTTWFEKGITALVVLLLAYYQLTATTGGSVSDATSYHLPYADWFLQNKGLAQAPEHLIYPYHSLNINLLFALGTLIERDLSYLQTLHALFATLTLLGIYALSLSISRRSSVGLLAVLLLVTTARMISSNRLSANVDCGSMFFVLASIAPLVLWTRQRNSWLLILAAISFGIAMGSKYLMCLFVLPVTFCICFTEKKLFPKTLFVFAGLAAIWGLWWYARNFLFTGNPVYPFASNIFGLNGWSEQDMKSQMDALLDTRIPRSLPGFIAMPWYASQNLFLQDQGVHWLLGMLYLTTALAIVLDRTANWLLPFAWTYVIAWFLGAQDPRYLMPAVPLIAVHASFLTHRLLNAIRPAEVAHLPATFLVVFCFSSLGSQLIQLTYRSFYARTGETYETQLHDLRQNPIIDLIVETNQRLAPDATVYEFFMREIRWFSTVNLVGNQFGPHGYVRTVDNCQGEDGSGLSPARLETYLIERYNAEAFLLPPPPYIIYNQQQFDEYFTVLYRNSGGTLYQLREKGPR